MSSCPCSSGCAKLLGMLCETPAPHLVRSRSPVRDVSLSWGTNQPRVDDTPLVFFASDRPAKSFAGDRDAFLGNYRSERNPLGVELNDCGGSTLEGGEPCAALQTELCIEPGSAKRMAFFLGAAPGGLRRLDEAVAHAGKLLNQVRQRPFLDAQSAKVKAFYDTHLSRSPVQSARSRTQRPGQYLEPHPVPQQRPLLALDQLLCLGPARCGISATPVRTLLAQVYRDPANTRQVLLFLLSQQFVDGPRRPDTTFPEERQPPSLSIHSDDHLWACRYWPMR